MNHYGKCLASQVLHYTQSGILFSFLRIINQRQPMHLQFNLKNCISVKGNANFLVSCFFISYLPQHTSQISTQKSYINMTYSSQCTSISVYSCPYLQQKEQLGEALEEHQSQSAQGDCKAELKTGFILHTATAVPVFPHPSNPGNSSLWLRSLA